MRPDIIRGHDAGIKIKKCHSRLNTFDGSPTLIEHGRADVKQHLIAHRVGRVNSHARNACAPAETKYARGEAFHDIEGPTREGAVGVQLETRRRAKRRNDRVRRKMKGYESIRGGAERL